MIAEKIRAPLPISGEKKVFGRNWFSSTIEYTRSKKSRILTNRRWARLEARQTIGGVYTRFNENQPILKFLQGHDASTKTLWNKVEGSKILSGPRIGAHKKSPTAKKE